MAKKPPPVAHVLSERFADADLVDRIFDYVVALLPELAQHQVEIKLAVREEFASERVYVRSRARETEQMRARAEAVLKMFNGRNATEVARTLQISRATVYRLLKQPGAAKR